MTKPDESNVDTPPGEPGVSPGMTIGRPRGVFSFAAGLGLALVLAGVSYAPRAPIGGDPGPPVNQSSSSSRHADAERRAEVEVRGAAVMPFDLSRTTHVFTDQPDGGLQSVTAFDPRDTRNIGLIRSHLRKEAARFTRGDFDDPAAIHGRDMPGLAELEKGAARIAVRYRELADGAALQFRAADPALAAAIHSWFSAQRSDHGGAHHAG